MKSGARRKARELALSILFEADVGTGGPGGAIANAPHTLEVLTETWSLNEREQYKLLAEIEEFGMRVADLFFRHAKGIDELISGYSQDWSLERMPGIDRNILRLALVEMQYCPDVPVSATINEAVELAKRFGGVESAKFVNGILGAYARDNKLTADNDGQ